MNQKHFNFIHTIPEFELSSYQQNYQLVAGIDEAGRGALAGPVSISFVSFPRGFFENFHTLLNQYLWIQEIHDSKQLNEQLREKLINFILQYAWNSKNILISSIVIDKIGINNAIEKGICILLRHLVLYSNHIYRFKFYIDGNYQFRYSYFIEEFLDFNQIQYSLTREAKKYTRIDFYFRKKPYTIFLTNVIKGDQNVFSIASASIMSKVYRDRYMKKISHHFPYYELEKHKGYGTKRHLYFIQKYGYSFIHRSSYKISSRSHLKFNQ